MLESIFAKTIWELRKSITWWIVGMVALAGLTVAFYPSIRGNAASFESLFESLPPGLLRVFGIEDASSLITPVGLVNSRLYSGVGPIILAVLGINLGTGAIAGEEERGTLDLLLAQPVTRTQVLVEKAVAAAVLIGLVIMALFLTLSILNPIVGLDFGFSGLLGANIALALFALLFFGFALAVGALTGNRGLTVGLAAGVTTTLFFVNGLAPLASETAWLAKLTPFYWLQHPNPLANGLDLVATVIFLAAIGLLMALAIWGFNRRDVSV